MNMNDLNKALNAAMTAVQAHEENVAEATSLFAAGKLSQDDIDQAIRERDAALARRNALQTAIEAAAARDEEVDAQAEVDARKAAARKAEKLLTERDKCAENLDSAINAMIATLARYDELNTQIHPVASAAGLGIDLRRNALNMRALGGLLTTKLARTANLATKLDVSVNRFDAFDDAAALTTHTGNQLRSHLERVV